MAHRGWTKALGYGRNNRTKATKTGCRLVSLDSIFGTIGHMVTRTHLIAFDADFDNELAFFLCDLLAGWPCRRNGTATPG
jgi:hypothetical protein